MEKHEKINRRKHRRKNHFCYLWISPFYILYAVFVLYPVVYGLYLSLTEYPGYGAPDFVGLANYIKLFYDAKFWNSLINTFLLWLYIVPLRTFLALLIAVVLNSSHIFGRKAYSFLVLLPYATAVSVVAIIFRLLFSTSGGAINNFLAIFGIQPIGWLDTTGMSKVSIAIMNIWKMTGYFSIVLLAGLQRISPSVNEAAELDGAGAVRKFFYITLPLMKPEVFFVAVLSTIWVVQNVSDVMVLTQGGPINSSTTTVYYMYQNAFSFSKLGYASAISYVLFLLLLFLSSFVMKNYMKKMEE